MSRWFRMYDDAINDPKVLRLPQPPHDAAARARAIDGFRRLRVQLEAGT